MSIEKSPKPKKEIPLTPEQQERADFAREISARVNELMESVRDSGEKLSFWPEASDKVRYAEELNQEIINLALSGDRPGVTERMGIIGGIKDVLSFNASEDHILELEQRISEELMAKFETLSRALFTFAYGPDPLIRGRAVEINNKLFQQIKNFITRTINQREILPIEDRKSLGSLIHEVDKLMNFKAEELEKYLATTGDDE